MLTWLKKFVLDIMPSVAATIIGAYIVNHYIVPKSPAAQQAAIVSTDSKSGDSKASESKPVDGSADKASFEKAVAEKTAIEKTAEKASSDKAANDKSLADKSSDTSDLRKHPPAPKLAAKPAPTPATDERRANDLARAAIERLAKSETRTEPAKADSAKVDAKLADAPRVQPVSTVASAPPMQPLPPAINVSTPNPDVFEQGSAAPVMRQPYPQAPSRFDEARESRRFVPPAEIPTSGPLDLRAEAMSTSSNRSSVAEDVVSAAKSMFHAVIPR